MFRCWNRTLCAYTYERGEDHEEAGGQVHVDRLDVGDLGQGRVSRGDEGRHSEHRRHPQSHAGRCGAPVVGFGTL
jgi:hypothetical protein